MLSWVPALRDMTDRSFQRAAFSVETTQCGGSGDVEEDLAWWRRSRPRASKGRPVDVDRLAPSL